MTNRWNACYVSRLHAGWNSHYMFENQCKQCDTRGWEVRLMLFNAMVVQVFLYGVTLSHLTRGIKWTKSNTCSYSENWR